MEFQKNILYKIKSVLTQKNIANNLKNILIYTIVIAALTKAPNYDLQGYSNININTETSEQINNPENAVALYVNNELIAAVSDENQLNLILEELKNQYSIGENVTFAEDIKIEKTNSKPETYDSLRKKVLFGEQKEIDYQVNENDSLSSLAEKFNITEEEIIVTNDLKDNNLLPNQKIKIKETKKILNVKSSKISCENLEIPYETQKISDNTLMEGTEKIIQKGETGNKKITKKIEYFNGIEQNCEILNTENIKEPIPQKILIGTKKIQPTTNDILKNLSWPVNYTKKITSTFGKRGKEMHYGIDISEKGIENQPICAVFDGIVEFAGSNSNGYGTHVIIDHGNGIKSLYAHCNPSLQIKKGDKISKNQAIAKVGSTGNSSGFHLHLGLIINGVYKNFMDYYHE